MTRKQGAKIVNSNPQPQNQKEFQIVAQEDNNPLPPISELENRAFLSIN